MSTTLVRNYSVSARVGQPVIWRGSNLGPVVFLFPLVVPFLVRACRGGCMFPSWLVVSFKTPGIPCVRELCSHIAADMSAWKTMLVVQSVWRLYLVLS